MSSRAAQGGVDPKAELDVPPLGMPKVTVVTVVRNDVRNIEATLVSVIGQTYPRLEYIVIDRGSEDGTVNVIERFRESIDWWISEPDDGVYDAMNKGIRRATGQWINFMNSNDWFYRDDTVERVFAKYPEDADFIYGNNIVVPEAKTGEFVKTARPLTTMWQELPFSEQSVFAKTQLMRARFGRGRLRTLNNYEFYFSKYVEGRRFHNSGETVVVCNAARDASNGTLWRDTLERWSIVRRYQSSLDRSWWYVNVFMRQIIRSAFHNLWGRQGDWKGLTVDVAREAGGSSHVGATRTTGLVSVVVANYNNGKFLQKCIESILGQTYPSVEVVVVDDCSDDESWSILEEYSNRDARVRALGNERNRGVAMSRHRGITAASGEFISTLDSDDYYVSASKIAREMDVIRRYRDERGKDVIAFSDVVLLDKDDRYLARASRQKPIREGRILAEIITRSCMIPRDFLFHRSIYEAVGGYDADVPIYEDWDLKIRMAARYEYHFSGVTGICYRRHGTGLSSAPPAEHGVWLRKILSNNLGLVDNAMRPDVEARALRVIDAIEHPP